MSTFVSNHEIVNASALRALPSRMRAANGSAQNLQTNPQILGMSGKWPAKQAGMVFRMAKIIPVSFVRSRLPRTLLRDGWWLESSPARPTVVAFPKRDASNPRPRSKSKASHLTLVHSRK
jgi:hypothetical protein